LPAQNDGDVTGKPGRGDHGRHHPGHDHEDGRPFSGKVAGLIFDRFGDFKAFLLDTEDGDYRFRSREKDVAELAERAWRERLRITVWADRDEPSRPLSIISVSHQHYSKFDTRGRVPARPYVGIELASDNISGLLRFGEKHSPFAWSWNVSLICTDGQRCCRRSKA
jgi:hypothetical protein